MKTRIVAVGPFDRHSYAHHWKGFGMGFEAIAESEDIEFLTLDFRDVVGAEPMNNRFDTDQPAVDRLKAMRPDVVIFGVQDAMTENMLDAARAAGAFVALWFCDLRWPVERDLCGRLDLLAMTNAGLRGAYMGAWGLAGDDVVWIPQACLPRKTIAKWESAHVADVVHVGSWNHPDFHESRRQVFFKVIGRYGARFPFDPDSDCLAADGSEPSAVFWNPVSDEDKADVTRRLPAIYASARLAVGVSDAIPGYHSNRIFLATGHGACYVCNHYPGLEKLFEPGKEVLSIAGLDTTPDLVLDTIGVYLGLADARDKIRQAAFRRAQADHTYLKRIRELWDCIERRR